MSYNTKGWEHLKSEIPKGIVSSLRENCLLVRDSVTMLSSWKGVSCAGKHNKHLSSFYRSEMMYHIVSRYLDPIYCFNDQVVVKLPKEDFHFEPHFDNQYGPNSDGKIHTINFCVILDDFTDENGALSVMNKDDEQWMTLYPKAGDIVAINGNTLHKSGQNRSSSPRALYACVYANDVLYLDEFYKDRFVI